MSMMKCSVALGAVVALCSAVFACSDDGTTSVAPAADAGAPAAKGGFQITVSGEALATTGYDFATGASLDDDPPPFVDGWEVKFEHVIVTVGKIRLNADPDLDEADPEKMGEEVATVEGTFAVDATIGGDVVGKSGEADEKTVAIAAIGAQKDGKPFDPASRYAFSYDLVEATAGAKLVNLDADGKALYEEAKTKKWAMIYAGTATYKGAEPAAGTTFAKLPKVVKFKLGFKNASSYINCQNADLNPTEDEHPRGVQASADKPTVAQITIHTDHAFWSKLNVEGTELHFDPIAARASTYGTPGSEGLVTIEDLEDDDVTAFTAKGGVDKLDGRSLVTGYDAPAGQLSFDRNGTTFAGGKPNSFAAYLAYSAASGGHLNADGECTVKNNFAP